MSSACPRPESATRKSGIQIVARGAVSRDRTRSGPACRCRESRRRGRTRAPSRALLHRRRGGDGMTFMGEQDTPASPGHPRCRRPPECAGLEPRVSTGRGGGGSVGARRAASNGSDTTNSLPRSIAFAPHSMLPPCSATRSRTSVRPTPRPPRSRSSDRSPCMNMSNTCGSDVRRDADAGIAHANADPVGTVDSSPVILGDEPDVSARRRELDRVVQQVDQYLRQAHGIGDRA